MKKFTFFTTVLALSSALFAAEPICLDKVQATAFSEETKASIAELFGLYLETQGNYQIVDTNCQSKATLSVSKIGKNSIIFAKLADNSNTMLWSGQQKAANDENIDEALQQLAKEFGVTPRKSVYASAPRPAEVAKPQKAAAVEPIVKPQKPRDINMYFGLGIGLTKFIGNEINEFTDHEPLSTYDFFVAYDAKNLITVINLDFAYKNNTLELSDDESGYYYSRYNKIETDYVSFGISFYYPILTGSISPYLGLGLATTNFNIDGDWNSIEYDDNGIQAHAGAGVLLNRGKRISMWVHGEYFFNTYEPMDHTFHGFSLTMKVALGV